MRKNFKHRITAELTAFFMAVVAMTPCNSVLNASAASYQKGDVTRDGKLTYADVDLMNKYLAGQCTLTSAQKLLFDVNSDKSLDTLDIDALKVKITKRLDVNSDGEVNNQDWALLAHFNLKQIQFSGPVSRIDNNYNGILDNYDVENMRTYLKKYCHYSDSDFHRMGDVTQDGRVNGDDTKYIMKHKSVYITLTRAESQLSDLDNDGDITMGDVSILMRFTTYKPGDVNHDGKINKTDKSILSKYIGGSITLSNDVLWHADYNGDGMIDIADVVSMSADYGI